MWKFTTMTHRAFLALLPAALVLSGCGEEESTGPDPAGSTEPRIVAQQSVRPVDGRISLDSVFSDGPGWLVVHRDNGQNAPVVPGISGKIHLDSGLTTGATLRLDSAVSNGEKIWLMLHMDDGVVGTYEFEGPSSPDQPVTSGTAVVMVSTIVVQTDPLIVVNDQMLINNGVSVDSVASPETAWLVFRRGEGGMPGDVLKSIRVDTGVESTGAQFPKEPAYSLRAGDTVWVALHIDRGTSGIFEYPGPDAPMRDASGEGVSASFVILPPDLQSVVAVDQPIDAGAIFIDEVHSRNPGWIVLHEDDGSGAPSNDKGVGWARVWSGRTTDIEVLIESPITPGVRIWAVLHTDDTPVGTYDWPTADLPLEQGGTIVADSFDITE